jgi:hypothetical protein
LRAEEDHPADGRMTQQFAVFGVERRSREIEHDGAE